MRCGRSMGSTPLMSRRCGRGLRTGMPMSARPLSGCRRDGSPAISRARAPGVRRQVAASLGEMPTADRLAPATAILARDGADPIIVDAAVSSLNGSEADVLSRMMQARPAAAPTEAVAMLAAAVAKSGDVAGVQ